MKKENVNILTIDGGGIRGLLPAEILVYVESKLKELYKDDNIKLADHFDFLVGTSTGGILTCLYTFPDSKRRPKYSAKEASDLYYKKGSKIFKKGLRFYLSLDGFLSYRYRDKSIEKLFNKYFGDIKISKSVKPLMVTSIDTDGRDLYLFKSYKALKYSKHDQKFSVAARATSAASTYFKPIKVFVGNKEMCLIDGGFGLNNPSIGAYVEALKLFPDAKKINIFSLGTGTREKSYPYKKASKWGIINGAPKMFELILGGLNDVTQYLISKLYEDRNISGEYLRIQPDAGEAENRMDKASKKNLAVLKKAGQDSVRLHKNEIDSFLERTFNKH